MKKYIKADDDWGFGYDSNGEPIDESTVDELYRVAEDEVLPKTKLAQLGNVTINENGFDYFFAGGIQGAVLHYAISLETDSEHIDLYKFMQNDYNSTMPDFRRSHNNFVNLNFKIFVDNDHVSDVRLVDADVYDGGNHSTYYTKKFEDAFDTDRLCEYITRIADSAADKIHSVLSNI